MFVWERLPVDSLVFISPCGNLPSSLDGKIIKTSKIEGEGSLVKTWWINREWLLFAYRAQDLTNSIYWCEICIRNKEEFLVVLFKSELSTNPVPYVFLSLLSLHIACSDKLTSFYSLQLFFGWLLQPYLFYLSWYMYVNFLTSSFQKTQECAKLFLQYTAAVI